MARLMFMIDNLHTFWQVIAGLLGVGLLASILFGSIIIIVETIITLKNIEL